MDAIFKMLSAASKLEMAARSGDETTATTLRKAMREVAAELTSAAEKAAPKWGELTGLIRDLEKGR